MALSDFLPRLTRVIELLATRVNFFYRFLLKICFETSTPSSFRQNSFQETEINEPLVAQLNDSDCEIEEDIHVNILQFAVMLFYFGANLKVSII